MVGEPRNRSCAAVSGEVTSTSRRSLPVSKLSDPGHRARELQHNDQPVLISYEAAWRKGSRAREELVALVNAIAATCADHADRAIRTSRGVAT